MLNNIKYKIFSERPFQVSKNDIIKSGFRTSPSSQRNIQSVIGVTLENQVDCLFNGTEIGSSAYVKKSNHRFIKTGNIQNDFLIDYSTVEYCKNTNNVVLQGDEILIAEDGGGDGLGESCLYIKDTNYSDYLCNGILALKIDNKEKRNFIFGFLKSNYFKEFIDNNTPMASTLRHSNGVAKRFLLPLYDYNNINHKLLSVLVENLIDKENQIILKNKIIDDKIKNELGIGNHGKVYASKTLLIKNKFKFSGGTYKQEYVDIVESVNKYPHGSFYIKDSEITCGNTPSDYYFSNKAKHLWITSKSIYSRNLNQIRKVASKKTPNLKDNDIILMSIGSGLGSIHRGTLYKTCLGTAFVNQNCYKINTNNLIKNINIMCFLTSPCFVPVIKNKLTKGSVPAIYSDEIKEIPIPNFPQNIQNDISLNYYNNVARTKNTLTTYLPNELQRNKELGIWQLNMECFELKSKINKIVEKIVLNKKIYQPFYLI